MITTVTRPDGGRRHIINVSREVDLDSLCRTMRTAVSEGIQVTDQDTTQLTIRLPTYTSRERASFRDALDRDLSQESPTLPNVQICAKRQDANRRAKEVMREFGISLSPDGEVLELRGEHRSAIAAQFGSLGCTAVADQDRNVIRIRLGDLEPCEKELLLKAAIVEIARHAAVLRASVGKRCEMTELKSVVSKIGKQVEERRFMTLIERAVEEGKQRYSKAVAHPQLLHSPEVQRRSREARKKVSQSSFFSPNRNRVAAAVLIVVSFFLGRNSKREVYALERGHGNLGSVSKAGQSSAAVVGKSQASHEKAHVHHQLDHEDHDHEHMHTEHNNPPAPISGSISSSSRRGNTLREGSNVGVQTNLSGSGSSIAAWNSLTPSQQAQLQQSRSQGYRNAHFHGDGTFSVQNHKRHE